MSEEENVGEPNKVVDFMEDEKPKKKTFKDTMVKKRQIKYLSICV